ncbi:MAG: ChrR family anti-sigma-E factor [Bradyrhizobium sp.]|uniref:ChrR family anti-sigma-E factor n=1 Tax=Bradyrhizobium sp. TaxID=376 RepID=UPI002728D9F6|nr:ChrR family anti-sigma-E factor [Bradyrhizobium sp.]MDO9564601.1 ChrR family anti-sigma-E factor [Bradyrhizobium sp.]MDP3690285.1 ChrR family anti-sigma-E factor [Bradyrhizobium sp.]
MTIKFHVGNDVLLSYSAGTLDEASSLLVATHLALCPHCRARNSSADALGGHLLDSLEATPVSPTMLAAVLAQVRSDASSLGPKEPSGALSKAIIPDPLRSYLGGDLTDLHWKRLAPRVQQISIATLDKRSQARLLRFQSGAKVPSHGHNGRELTLILTGTLCDRNTVLHRGDIAETDESTEHQPFAGAGEDCICLAVTDAPLRFKSMFARLLQPLFGI